MAWSVNLNGITYTDNSVRGRNYANEQTGLPAILRDIVAHVSNAWRGTSTTSLVVGAGSKVLTLVSTGVPFNVGQPVRIARTSDPLNVFMDGEVSALSGSQLTVSVVSTKGAGTYTDWTVFVGGYAKVSPSASPVPVSEGGTGATSVGGVQTNFDILTKAGNLAGLSNPGTARGNLGLGTLATLSSPVPLANGGTGSTTAATARTALGLGSAATLNGGTAAGNVPVMDGLGRYPAADGSQITNLPSAPNPIPAGTKMLFVQSSAPAGWVQDATLNDRVLRVVNNNSGGQTGGSWTVTGLTITQQTFETVLSVNQIPSHTHQYNQLSEGSGYQSGSGQTAVRFTPLGVMDNTGATGGGQGHAHTINDQVFSDSQWRPSYLNVIVCTKQ